MKISMWMLYDALSDECASHNLDDRSKKICLKGCLPYQGPDDVADAYLYLVDASRDEPLILPQSRCFLAVVGENFVTEETGACQYIVMRQPHLFMTALQCVLRAFEKYEDWLDALQDELNGTQDLGRLCRLGSAMLENDTMLYDREYTIIAGDFIIDSGSSDRYEKKNGPFYALSAAALRQLKNSAGFQQTFQQSDAAVYKVDFLPQAVLYVNLGRGSVYEGRLCVMENRPFKKGDFQIAEILTGFLRIAIKRQAVRASEESRKFEAFILQLLDGHTPGDEQIDAALGLWHWKRHARYVCIHIEQSEQDAQTSSDLYLVSKLTLTLPGSCSMRYQSGIACIVRLSEKETPQNVADKLASLLGGFVPCIGISDVFMDFQETAQYYKQAVIAAGMDTVNSRGRWCRHFRDYAMAHYFRHGTSFLPALHFCHEDVRRLMFYRGTRTDYYNTLKVYLENNMNLLLTAQALFIHRTTLFNRINRIRELITADLDDPEDRVSMLISFKLMEADKMYRHL